MPCTGAHRRGSVAYLLLTVFGFALSACSLAQNRPTAAPAFEVSTVKPSNPNAKTSNLNLNVDAVVSKNLPIRFLLQFAYDLNTGSHDQMIGAPAWVDTERFDITAKESDEVAAAIGALTPDDRTKTLREMIQVLLAERFALKAHHEMRDLPVLALVVTKNGPRLTAAADSAAREDSGGSGIKAWKGLHNPNRGKTEGRSVPLKLLAAALSDKPEVGGRMVVDDTGLKGEYSFVLTWTPEDASARDPGGATAGPSLFTALQEQLGLKLEPRKVPVDCIVIDNLAQPTAN